MSFLPDTVTANPANVISAPVYTTLSSTPVTTALLTDAETILNSIFFVPLYTPLPVMVIDALAEAVLTFSLLSYEDTT